ncbi:hypothetical protein PPL_04579 [Heterostelium album PN500]|uniref:Uncharacterized protein n=1 Tax=Heterostelium pallidum (strain ATCC 26659 / Pp 5 / PN500) TaxID=670386 RepID=D3B7Z1_HETP5|nr:hypothetical protein PPL_04579 [Heterostelium album PN500]EFA82159.1 hypothetical protein PPL_04579 [Heterostelium album PN500]|eukprot:XP_020434276.1 hypothetical protein PPL_04579 [Heterostelium album PN500]
MDNGFILYDRYHDYMLLCSMLIVLLSFLVWRNSFFLSPLLRNIQQILRGEQRSSTPQSSSSSSSSQQQSQQQQTQSNDQVQQTEPFTETLTGNDVFDVNIIQSETTYHRQYKKSKIHTVYDLKKYFYPNDVASQKRIIFIHNVNTIQLVTSSTEYQANSLKDKEQCILMTTNESVLDGIKEIEFTGSCFLTGVGYIPGLDRVDRFSFFNIEYPVVDCHFPNNLRSLSIGSDSIFWSFDEGLHLPEQLESLELGLGCEYLLAKGFLPASLKKLTLHHQYTARIRRGVLPKSLESLTIQCKEYNQPITRGTLPNTLKYLSLSSYSGDLLFYNDEDENDDDNDDDDDDRDTLIDGLNTHIPMMNLEYLAIGTPYGKNYSNFKQRLPDGLKVVDLLSNFQQAINKKSIACWPSSIETLCTTRYPSLTKSLNIPSSVRTLKINHLVPPLKKIHQPNNIKSIAIDNMPTDSFNFTWLSPNITSIALPMRLCTPGKLESLPITLRDITVLQNFDHQILYQLRRLDSTQKFIIYTPYIQLNKGRIIHNLSIIKK